MATEKFQLMHEEMTQALQDLSDPEKTVCRSLVEGKAAGEMALMHVLFPPAGIHPNQVPARFTFQVEGHITYEIPLMVYHFVQAEPYLAMGLVAHNHSHSMRVRARNGLMLMNPRFLWVAVRCFPVLNKFVDPFRQVTRQSTGTPCQ